MPPFIGYNPFTGAGGAGASAGAGAPSTIQTAYTAEILLDSPEGFWKLDEASGTSVTDSSGNSNTLTHGAGVVINAAGPFEGSAAATYDGTSTSYSTGSPLLGTTNITSYTLEGWIRQTAATIGGNDYFIGQFAQETNNYTNASLFHTSTRKIYMDEFLPSGQILISTDVIVRDVWSYVCAVKDGGITRRSVWIDGNVTTAETVETTGTQTMLEFLIGSKMNSAGYNDGFIGDISNVAVYLTPLSTARIAAHYAAGIA